MAEKILKCDFCSDHDNNPPISSYGCRDFAQTDMGVNFLNNWFACHRCDELIQADNLRGLIDRAVATYIEKHGSMMGGDFGPKDQIKHHVTQIHVKFWNHRTGSREEVKNQ